MRILNSYYSKEYFLGIPDQLSMVNLGSTYSLFAFNNYRELNINGCNLAQHQNPLEYDWDVLKKYYTHLQPGAMVAITLAPCVMMSRPFIRKKEKFLSKAAIKNKIKAITGRFTIGDITDYFPIAYTDELVNEKILGLVKGWETLFSLPNLKEASLSENNLKNIRFNVDILAKMINFCCENNFMPVVVITPMSELLNQHFSDEFVYAALHNPIKMALEQSRSVKVLDYRKDPMFSNHPSFWLDGGCRLNKLGSKVFMRRFITEAKMDVL